MKLVLFLTILIISSCATRKDVVQLENRKNAESKVTKKNRTRDKGLVKDLYVTQPVKKFEKINTRYQDEREFFAVADSFLVSGFELDSKSMDDPIFKTWVIEDKLWRVEKVEKLKSIGLKKGAVVQYFNFEDKKMKKYEIKDSVHIRMVHQSSMVNEKDAPNFRTFYVLLSDDITQGKDEYADADSDKTTGIAYLGERFTLNPVQDVTPSPAQEIDLKDTEFKTIVSLFDEKLVNSGLSDHKIGKASYTSYKNNRIYNLLFISDNHKPYSEDDSRDHDDSGSVLRTSTDKIWIISSPEKFHDYGSGGISTWNFVEEAGAGFLEQEGGMHSCMVVHLLIGDEMERHQIQCDSGGC